MKSKVAYQVPWFVVLRGEREVDDDVEVGLTLGQDLQGPIMSISSYICYGICSQKLDSFCILKNNCFQM